MNKVLKIASEYSDKKKELFLKENLIEFFFNGVYLDGEIERICEYDICYPINPEDFEDSIKEITIKYSNWDTDSKEKYLFLDGIYQCIVDDKYDCTAFLWYNKDEVNANLNGEIKYLTPECVRGLIVLNTDKDNLENIRQQYENGEGFFYSKSKHK